MTTLTDDDLRRIEREKTGAWARPVEQWMEILANRTPEAAAARIFGDLHCYTADRNVRGYPQRREQFPADVINLARALQAWAAIIAGEKQ